MRHSWQRFDRMHRGCTVTDRLLCNDTADFSAVPDVSYDPNYTPTSGTTDLFVGPGLSPDSAYAPGYSPVVPDTTQLNLPGQLNGLPGGGASSGTVTASDPMGINAVHTAPGVNPTPTGGYMQSLAQVAAAASQSFSTFVKGSPSVAVPAAKSPLTGGIGGALSLTTPTGGTNWLLVGGVLALLAIGVVVVVKYA
jgi:hypothetical protein